MVVKTKKDQRTLKPIDYAKSVDQPIIAKLGVFVRPFRTAEGNQGVAIVDKASTKVICLTGIGKNGKFYRLTEIPEIQWTPDQEDKKAIIA